MTNKKMNKKITSSNELKKIFKDYSGRIKKIESERDKKILDILLKIDQRLLDKIRIEISK